MRADQPSILTNMAYWQSPEWVRRTTSIYPLENATCDPAEWPWWREAWRLFIAARGFDVVLTLGIRTSFAYALLCRLSGRPSRQIMCEVFIDQSQPDRCVWRMKTRFYRWLARDAVGFITNSTGEIATNALRFGVPESRFNYVPLSSTIDLPERVHNNAGYYFCGGRTLRDYETLKQVMRAVEEPWQVVAGADDLRGETFPERITIHREIPREKYLDLLRRAKCVVLPLLATERATGQVVLLEAMSYGKPCITTRAPGTIDIIEHGKNGLLAETGNADEIVDLINRLKDNPEQEAAFAKAGYATIIAEHTHARHTQRRLEAIHDLWSQSMANRT